MKKSNLILRLIFLVTLLLLLALRLLYFNLIIINNSAQEDAQIEEKIEGPQVITDEPIEETKDKHIEKLEELYKENKDTVGYLIIPGTKIEYPVMYTKGEDYYLRRSFKKIYSVAGSIYIDKHNTLNPRDDNLIFYGHNMDNGTMFADLLKYKNKAFFTGHKTIYYYTLNGMEEYSIVAVFLSKVYTIDDNVFKYYKAYNFNTIEEFTYFKDNIESLRLYDTYNPIEYKDKFITLSTCEYTEKNGRLVVIAKKV